jgi:hypothetical protein
VDPTRENVLEETPNEFAGVEGHDSRFPRVGIPVPKGHLSVFDREKAAVGEGNSMDVAAEIFQDFLRALDGRFTVNHPVLLPQGRRQLDLGELPSDVIEDHAAKELR